MSNEREVTFSSVAGIPLHYSRDQHYGVRGRNINFASTQRLKDVLDRCFRTLSEESPFGQPDIVVTAGLYVNKPGFHGRGLAIDVDAIYWQDRTLVSVLYPFDQVHYLAVESVFRQYFGTVLNYLYDPAHEDHWHMDLGTRADFYTDSPSRVFYLQASLTYIHDHPVLIDGVWGRQTGGAIQEVLRDMSLSTDIENMSTWQAYLRRTAKKGFDMVAQEPVQSPQQQLKGAIDSLFEEDVRKEQHKELAQALLNLSHHPDLRGSEK